MDLDGAPMEGGAIDGLPLGRAPEDELDGCPMGWDPLDGVPVDDIDGVPLGAAGDDIDGMPCESATSFKQAVHACRILLLIDFLHVFSGRQQGSSEDFV